jgi:hypothetical protein
MPGVRSVRIEEGKNNPRRRIYQITGTLHLYGPKLRPLLDSRSLEKHQSVSIDGRNGKGMIAPTCQ